MHKVMYLVPLLCSISAAHPTIPQSVKMVPPNLQLVYAQAIPASDESMIPAETFWGGYNGYDGRRGWKQDQLSSYATYSPTISTVAVSPLDPLGSVVYSAGQPLYGTPVGWKNQNGGRVDYSGWRGDSPAAAYSASGSTTWNGAGPGWRN